YSYPVSKLKAVWTYGATARKQLAQETWFRADPASTIRSGQERSVVYGDISPILRLMVRLNRDVIEAKDVRQTLVGARNIPAAWRLRCRRRHRPSPRRHG